MLISNNITVQFGAKPLFENVSVKFGDNNRYGLIGANGCGKSNIVEALKWVMGESRSKQLRGADMEEVIFNGSSDRPARNVAEVELVMSNADGSLPPQYTEHPTVGVSRRIERGKGAQ